MTPEREVEIRAWCKEWEDRRWPTYAHDLLEALDVERAKALALEKRLAGLSEWVMIASILLEDIEHTDKRIPTLLSTLAALEREGT